MIALSHFRRVARTPYHPASLPLHFDYFENRPRSASFSDCRMKYLPQAELLETIETEHARLTQTLASISQSHLHLPGVLPGQSCKDILAHLTAWEQRMLQLVKAIIANTSPPQYLATAPFNEQVFHSNKDRSLEDIQSDFERSYRETVTLIGQLNEANLQHEAVWKLIGYNTYNHYKWARTLIRRWQRTNTIAP
jgi:hypothetical protein